MILEAKNCIYRALFNQSKRDFRRNSGIPSRIYRFNQFADAKRHRNSTNALSRALLFRS